MCVLYQSITLSVIDTSLSSFNLCERNSLATRDPSKYGLLPASIKDNAKAEGPLPDFKKYNVIRIKLDLKTEKNMIVKYSKL